MSRSIPPFDEDLLSHKNNLLQKQKIVEGSGTDKQKRLLEQVWVAYEAYVAEINYDAHSDDDYTSSVNALNKYVDFAKAVEKEDSKFFSWRSDFAGSIIPEFIFRAADVQLKKSGLKPLYSKSKAVLEITPDPRGVGFLIIRKNQDFCVGFSEVTINEGETDVNLLVPCVAAEIKTNIDKNKINGLEYTAKRLKRTFPAAKYILISETLDFSINDNRASGPIDEVYILRKQIRSQARVEGGKKPLQPDVFSSVISYIVDVAEKMHIQLGHVYDRLETGRLL